MLLRGADGRCPLSNNQAGSLQTGPVGGISEPWDGARGDVLAGVGAGCGQPSVHWTARPELEGLCHMDSELLVCDRFG